MHGHMWLCGQMCGDVCDIQRDRLITVLWKYRQTMRRWIPQCVTGVREGQGNGVRGFIMKIPEVASVLCVPL